MPDTLATALIGACATVAGAVVPQLFSWHSQIQRTYVSSRFRIVEGAWEGVGEDFYVENGGPMTSFHLRPVFRKTGRRIEADADLHPCDRPEINIPLVVSGGFYNDDLLQFFYRSKDPSRKQMGAFVLRLSDDGRNLGGHFAGFSPTRGVFVVGKVALHKV